MTPCPHCNGPTNRVEVHTVDKLGQIWRVPVEVCRSPGCLKRHGGKLTQIVPVGGVRVLHDR